MENVCSLHSHMHTVPGTNMLNVIANANIHTNEPTALESTSSAE